MLFTINFPVINFNRNRYSKIHATIEKHLIGGRRGQN
jgi:hypothetical protein